MVIYSNIKWEPNDNDIKTFLSYTRFIEEKLYHI
ncbi:MAG: hypothetical protein JWM44_2482, partial [Bacilli bacterium]|nr:hypothetical protein [Bacilli bacterium]